jgi:hypothetical protein
VLDVAVVLSAVGGAATCAAVLVLFLGALREATIANVLFCPVYLSPATTRTKPIRPLFRPAKPLVRLPTCPRGGREGASSIFVIANFATEQPRDQARMGWPNQRYGWYLGTGGNGVGYCGTRTAAPSGKIKTCR